MQLSENTAISQRDLLSAIRQPVAIDLQHLDQLILNELHSDIALIQVITKHIITSGGKRLRPLIVLLCALASGYTGKSEHLELAAIIEFVHTATLLHDDVIDGSLLRRGKDTANALYGNQASVLVGDFLYSRSFQILTRRSNVPVMQVLANTTNAIAEGEVLQLMNCNDPDTNEKAYYQVIERKTAKLFESACEIGAMLGSSAKPIHQAAATYGLHIGYAFQIIDDVLDYQSSAEKMGKNVGDDLAEGKVTLPLIYTLQHTTPAMKQCIETSVKQGSKEHIDVIIQAMYDCNAFDYCIAKTQTHIDTAKQALTQLNHSAYRNALEQLLDFVVTREF
ncbi:MAG: octaprenyl diphosphate synthase [Coxiella sp. (in: Bacteria)]|nr:MAG: octaprenyl diphosphate synthase [Coxiella sp. (in: g-proteobacteria)]